MSAKELKGSYRSDDKDDKNSKSYENKVDILEDDDLGGSISESKYEPILPKIDIKSISFQPNEPALIQESLRLKIKFELDRCLFIFRN